MYFRMNCKILYSRSLHILIHDSLENRNYEADWTLHFLLRLENEKYHFQHHDPLYRSTTLFGFRCDALLSMMKMYILKNTIINLRRRINKQNNIELVHQLFSLF